MLPVASENRNTLYCTHPFKEWSPGQMLPLGLSPGVGTASGARGLQPSVEAPAPRLLLRGGAGGGFAAQRQLHWAPPLTFQIAKTNHLNFSGIGNLRERYSRMYVGYYSSQAGQVFSNPACPYIDWCFPCFTFMKPDLDFVAVLLKSDIQSVVISLLGLSSCMDTA